MGKINQKRTNLENVTSNEVSLRYHEITINKKNYRVRIAVPLAELILSPLIRFFLCVLVYTDDFIPTVPRFVQITVSAGKEAIILS